MRVDVVDSLLHGGDLFRIFIRNLALEFLFQRHHQFNRIQGIRAQIVDERGLVLDFGLVYAELFGNDFLDALFNFPCNISLP